MPKLQISDLRFQIDFEMAGFQILGHPQSAICNPVICNPAICNLKSI
jgi:hypothetical protein